MRCECCGSCPDAGWRWCPDCGAALVDDSVHRPTIDVAGLEAAFCVEWTPDLPRKASPAEDLTIAS